LVNGSKRKRGGQPHNLNGLKRCEWSADFDLTSLQGILAFLRALVKSAYSGSIGSRQVGCINSTVALILQHMVSSSDTSTLENTHPIPHEDTIREIIAELPGDLRGDVEYAFQNWLIRQREIVRSDNPPPTLEYMFGQFLFMPGVLSKPVQNQVLDWLFTRVDPPPSAEVREWLARRKGLVA